LTGAALKVAERVRFQDQLRGNRRGVLSAIETDPGPGPSSNTAIAIVGRSSGAKLKYQASLRFLSAMTVSSYCLMILPFESRS